LPCLITLAPAAAAMIADVVEILIVGTISTGSNSVDSFFRR
jgi:hypothetical protein